MSARAVRQETQHSTCAAVCVKTSVASTLCSLLFACCCCVSLPAVCYVVCARCTWDVFFLCLNWAWRCWEKTPRLCALFIASSSCISSCLSSWLFGALTSTFWRLPKFGLQANIDEKYAHFRQCEEDLGSEVVFRMEDELSIESGISGLMSLTFVTNHLFQFPFAVNEQYSCSEVCCCTCWHYADTTSLYTPNVYVVLKCCHFCSSFRVFGGEYWRVYSGYFFCSYTPLVAR